MWNTHLFCHTAASSAAGAYSGSYGIVAFATDDHASQDAFDALVFGCVDKRVEGDVYVWQENRNQFYIAIHQVSLLSPSATVARRLRLDVHDNDDNDNA